MVSRLSQPQVPGYAHILAWKHMARLRRHEDEASAIEWLGRFADYWSERGYDVGKYRREIENYKSG